MKLSIVAAFMLMGGCSVEAALVRGSDKQKVNRSLILKLISCCCGCLRKTNQYAQQHAAVIVPLVAAAGEGIKAAIPASAPVVDGFCTVAGCH